MSNKEETVFYKSILKATSAFGVFQILRILIRLLVGKVTAVFLGPSGIGLVGLIENALNLISSISSFGISISGVRQVTLDDNTEQEKETIKLIKDISIYTGILGSLIVLIFSPFLSLLIYGSADKFYWFLILSLYFVFNSIFNANNVILQGKRKLRLLLFSNFIITCLIAIVSYLLYYLYREIAIVPVLVVSAFLSMLVSHFFTRKLYKISAFKTTFSLSETIAKGIPLLKMGILLSTNVIIGQICFYLLRVYLKSQDVSVSVLGYYEVANVFIVSYLNLVFLAMSNDYYPRLTSLVKEKNSFNNLVNQQMQVALLIVTPLVLFFYSFQETILKILYTEKFIPVTEILQFGLFSLVIKAIVWPLGFIPLAKNDNKEYFKQNVAGDLLNVVFTILLFSWLGLKGLGLAILLNFAVFLCYSVFVSIKKYDFSFQSKTIIVLIVSVFLGISSLYAIALQSKTIAIVLLIFSILFSGYNFYKNLRKPI